MRIERATLTRLVAWAEGRGRESWTHSIAIIVRQVDIDRIFRVPYVADCARSEGTIALVQVDLVVVVAAGTGGRGTATVAHDDDVEQT